MTEGKRGFTTRFPVFILHATHIIGTSEKFVHILSGQHESVLMRVYSAIKSSESKGGHGEPVVIGTEHGLHENQNLSAEKKHGTAGRRLFLTFFELSF